MSSCRNRLCKDTPTAANMENRGQTLRLMNQTIISCDPEKPAQVADAVIAVVVGVAVLKGAEQTTMDNIVVPPHSSTPDDWCSIRPE